MNSIDLVVIAIIGISTLYSTFRGAVKEIFSILALVLGIIGALYVHGPVGDFLATVIGNPTFSKIAAFVAVFLGVIILVVWIGKALRGFLYSLWLGWLDKLIGAGIGFIKGFLIVAVILILVTTYVPESGKVLDDSIISYSVLSTANLALPLFPKSLREAFKSQHDRLKESTEDYPPLDLQNL